MTKISALALGAALLILAAFGISARNHAVSAQAPQAKPAKDIPDAVVYRHLFRLANDLKKKGDDLEKEGKDATSIRTHFKRKANLTDVESDALNEVAAQCVAEMQVVDAQAKIVIANLQAQYPGGQLSPGQRPPAPSDELKRLSAARDSIVLRARDNLRARFGDEDFNRFHNGYVKRQVAQNLQQAGTK
jgi:hypothetical protein